MATLSIIRKKMISALQGLRTLESHPVNSLCQKPAIGPEYKTQFQILTTGQMHLSHFISHKQISYTHLSQFWALKNHSQRSSILSRNSSKSVSLANTVNSLLLGLCTSLTYFVSIRLFMLCTVLGWKATFGFPNLIILASNSNILPQASRNHKLTPPLPNSCCPLQSF